MGKKRQRAELRVVLDDSSSFALLGSLNVYGQDIYCSNSPRTVAGRKIEVFRTSFHERGPIRLHLPSETVASHLGKPTSEITGAVKLTAGAGTPVWGYKPKPDSVTRRTVYVSAEESPRGVALEYWAIEKGRPNLVEEVLEGIASHPGRSLITQVLSDWTEPQVMIVAHSFSEASFKALQRAMGQDG